MNIPKLPELPFNVNHGGPAISRIEVANWYAELEAWHAKVFEGAIEAYGQYNIEGFYNFYGAFSTCKPIRGTDTHKAILIRVEPVEEETIEDILREMLIEAEEADSKYVCLEKSRVKAVFREEEMSIPKLPEKPEQDLAPGWFDNWYDELEVWHNRLERSQVLIKTDDLRKALGDQFATSARVWAFCDFELIFRDEEKPKTALEVLINLADGDA